MAGQPIQFPTSTAPGVNLTETGGRLINAYAEKAAAGSRSEVVWRRAPGLVLATLVGAAGYRGSVIVDSILYVVNGSTAYTISKSGVVYTVTALAGTVPGTGPVQMERNMNAAPQILIVHSLGMSKIIASVVSDFVDPDLPAINSIAFLDGYFLVTSAAGKAYSSAINDITFNALDNATAEARPDGIVRGVAFGRDYLMMGGSTTEFWNNTANPTGFPLSRGPVLSLGLKGTYAVAGMEDGFPEPLVWVASDNTVRRLVGYAPQRISDPVLERLIEAVTDPETLRMSVYVAAGHACVVLTSPDWTWVYDLSTGNWHERASLGDPRWVAEGGVRAFNEWLTFQRDGNAIYRVDANARREDQTQLVWEVWSTQDHRFPGGFQINRASFDIVTGVGIDAGISPIQTDPVVMISWSNDGGRTWGSPIKRRLGTTGEITSIDINGAGHAKRFGRIWKLRIADPVEVALIGGAMDAEPLLA